MVLNIILGFMCLVISSASASPLPLANNVFTDGWTKENIIVKRRSFEDNPDTQLKQVSLSSLVKDLEKSIFASALSLNKVLTDKNVTVPEIKLNNGSRDDANKSQMLTNEEEMRNEAANTLTTAKSETIISLSKTDTVILQTTEKVPQTVDTPTHIIIDRITIQPHTGGVALIPTFDLEQSENESTATKFTVSKTQITSSATSTPESSGITSSSNSTTTQDASITTPKSIEQLKEAEEELKEKLAEIEAEPVILSARV